MNQKQLIQACKNGSRKAQLHLYDQYSKGMYHVALRYVNDTFTAEDIMQEAFIKLFKNIDQFKAEVSIGAYLKRIVINNCIDYIKKKRIDTISIKEEILHVVDNDDWALECDISYDQVLAGIEQLKEHYRWVLKLYLLEGYDHAEIAQILGISEVLSRTHLMRGRKELKEQLKQYYYA
ncbi:MAG: RNA polymerase sigma factor [Flavobacteriaceae bacterium]